MNWIKVTRLPEIGGEYIVAWDVEDGNPELCATMMVFDLKKQQWFDPQGVPDNPVLTVKFWMPFPTPPKD